MDVSTQRGREHASAQVAPFPEEDLTDPVCSMVQTNTTSIPKGSSQAGNVSLDWRGGRFFLFRFFFLSDKALCIIQQFCLGHQNSDTL